MMKAIVIAAVILLALFVTIVVQKRSHDSSRPQTEAEVGLSDDRKTEIRRFWKVYHRATDLMRAGTWDEARTAYQEALAIDPRHENSLYYLGNVAFEMNRYDEALTAWRQLIAVNPMNARAHIQIGSVYSCGAENAPFDLDAAEEEFLRALAINKEETGPVLKLGEVCVMSGQEKRALHYFGAAIGSNSKSVPAHYLTGYLRWRAGHSGAARDALGQAVVFSRRKPPTAEPAGEGDTKVEGGGPILAEGAIRKSFFAPHWTVLKDWEGEEVSIARSNAEYAALDNRLKRLVGQNRPR